MTVLLLFCNITAFFHFDLNRSIFDSKAASEVISVLVDISEFCSLTVLV